MPRSHTSWPYLSALVVAGGLGVTAAAQAQTSQLSDADRDFIEKAAESNHAEIDMGKTAAESKNPAIKAFGEEMIHDHSAMNQELMALAQTKGVEPPASADLASQAKGAVTSMLPGTTFDKEYVSSQLTGHKEALELMQAEAMGGSDPELKALAAKAIPVVEKHIAALEVLEKSPELQ